MRNLISFAGAGLAMVIGFDMAQAADVGREVAPPPGFSWTGVYIGANGGYGESPFYDQLADLTNAGSPFSGLSPRGAFGGAQIGANWQIPGGPLVVGLEADMQGSGIRDSQTWAVASNATTATRRHRPRH